MTPTWAYRDFEKFIILLLLLGQRIFFTENVISVSSNIRERGGGGGEGEGGRERKGREKGERQGRKGEKGERKRRETGE